MPPASFMDSRSQLPPARNVEWVRISTGRRLGFAGLAALMLLVFAAIAWLDLQARSTGMIDMALMGGTLAGGGFALFTAVTGKEQRKVRPW